MRAFVASLRSFRRRPARFRRGMLPPASGIRRRPRGKTTTDELCRHRLRSLRPAPVATTGRSHAVDPGGGGGLRRWPAHVGGCASPHNHPRMSPLLEWGERAFRARRQARRRRAVARRAPAPTARGAGVRHVGAEDVAADRASVRSGSRSPSERRPVHLSEVPDDIYGWLVEATPPPPGLSLWATPKRADAPSDGIRGTGFRSRRSRRTGERFGFRSSRPVSTCWMPACWMSSSCTTQGGRSTIPWSARAVERACGRATDRRVVDIGALPLLESPELSWFRGPRLVFAPSTYRRQPREPLSPETSFSFFPPFPPGVTAVFAPGE